jgi:hypothetical protein
MNFMWPDQTLRHCICPCPDTFHLRIYFAGSVQGDSSTRPITEIFRAVHRADHSGGVEDTLPAHLASEGWFFCDDFDRAEYAVQKLGQTGSCLDILPDFFQHGVIWHLEFFHDGLTDGSFSFSASEFLLTVDQHTAGYAVPVKCFRCEPYFLNFYLIPKFLCDLSNE